MLLAIEIIGYVIAAISLFGKTATLESSIDITHSRLVSLWEYLRTREFTVPDVSFFEIICFFYAPIVALTVLFFPDKTSGFLLETLGVKIVAEVAFLLMVIGVMISSIIVLPVVLDVIGLLLVYTVVLLLVRATSILLVICGILAYVDRHPDGSVGGIGLLLTLLPRLFEWLSPSCR